MVTLSIAMMLAAGSALPSYILPPSKPARCADACAERYRVPASAGDGYSAKYRAVADDGTKCNVISAKRCSVPRKTILHSGEDPLDTWRAQMNDN